MMESKRLGPAPMIRTFFRADLSDIPVEVVAPSSAFGEDFQVHRSVSGLGGVETLVQAPVFVSSKHYGGPRIFGNNEGMFADATPSPAKKLHATEPTAIPKDPSTGSDDSISLQVGELPDVPFFLEPNGHVYVAGRMPGAHSSSSLDTLMRLVEEAMAACHVDYVFRPEKCKWKAQRCQQYTKVDFRARIYRCNDGDFVLEFQKRQGDYFLMRDVFERVISSLEDQGLVRSLPQSMSPPCELGLGFSPPAHFGKSCSPFASGDGVYVPPPSFSRSSSSTTASFSSNSSTASSSFSSSPGQAFSVPPPDVGGMADAMDYRQPPCPPCKVVGPLIRMAEAECHLLNFEGANALASLSASEDNRALLKEAGAIPALVGLIKRTSCKDVKQAVVTALSNLSESASCKCPIVEAGACRDLLELLSRGADGDCHNMYRELEMRRECARALANLSEDYAPRMVSEIGKEAVLAWVSSLELVGDERLRMHARRFHTRVRCCC